MPASPRPGKNWIAALSLTICAMLLALIHLYRPQGTGLWMETFTNSVHVPVFALIALGLFVALRSLTKLRFWGCVAVTTALALLLAALSEVAQISGPRDASLEDMIADWLGSISMLTLIIAFSRRSKLERQARAFWAIAGIIVISMALKPLILVSVAYVERNRHVPVLFNFEVPLSQTFLRLQNSTLEIIDHPSGRQKIGEVTFESGPWPGLIFHDMWPNWSDYSFLVIELAIDGSQPLEIHIRVHDWIHTLGSQPYNDRFNLSYTLQNGSQITRIPLDEIRAAPSNREMDLSRIHGMVVFATRAEAGRSFELVEIRLE